MKIKNTLCLAAAFAMALGFTASTQTTAAEKINVLVVDSGSDFTHKTLKPAANPNKAELNGKAKADDDKNGYVDDVYGWNFVENNNVLVNLEDTPPDYDTVLKVMEYINRMQQSGKEDFTQEEWEWLVKHYNDKELSPWVAFVGGWAHGTHCAGIIAQDNKAVQLNAIRHIPTGSAPQSLIKKAFEAIKFKLAQRINTKAAVTREEIEKYFDELGKSYAAEVTEKAEYIGSLKPRLINCSFGSPNQNLLQMMKRNALQWGLGNLSGQELQDLVNLFVTKAFLPRDKALFSKCKDALIFIAAGNSSEDLDGFVNSPGSVPIDNKIVIAATDRDLKLADFSCYGGKNVDVAVPGVKIFATYPNQKMGYMSGTSMACPNALRMASMVLEANPNLTPVELKKILMNTVDKKDWLKGKVKSGGVINVERAIEAAKARATGLSITEACKSANKVIADKVIRSPKTKVDLNDPQVRKIYFENVF